MKELNYRQVHLDFHTSEFVPSVGDRFDKEEFKKALKTGHINSITLFSKCHHGWSYHPTRTNIMHPKLKFDLLGSQLEACREIGVNAPVYLSAGCDEKYARDHEGDLVKDSPSSGADFLNRAYFKLICFNSPYLDILVSQVEEVMEKYSPSGIFLDISEPRLCYCQHCITSMREKGLDPRNIDDVRKQGEEVYEEYCRRIEKAVHKYNPEATIFHNAGHIRRGRRDYAHFNTHLELESLPTGGWGYDHFPMSAAYARTLGMEFSGMTGKFHASWGEFGGFKHPNALRYETALSLAEGARCCIGDQLHPTGEMNMSTYKLIGKAYAEVEAKEPYVRGAENIADIAVLSAEAFTGKYSHNCIYDVGATRMLLEGKLLFNLIDRYSDLSEYKLVILPDVIRIDDEYSKKLSDYIKCGGKVICSGESGLFSGSDSFAIDLGAVYEGENFYQPSYMVPGYSALNGETSYVIYTKAHNVTAACENTEAFLEEPYFNRAPDSFCSHQHTPNRMGKRRAGAVLCENTAYIAWNIFEDYAQKGSYHSKELVLHLIDMLMPKENRSASTNLPDRGVLTYTRLKNRFTAHLLFAHTSVRGSGIEIIEDTVPVYGVELSAATGQKPRRVFKAEYSDGKMIEKNLEFTFCGGMTKTTVDSVNIHAMVIFEI